jgi:carboxypeptidase Q
VPAAAAGAILPAMNLAARFLAVLVTSAPALLAQVTAEQFTAIKQQGLEHSQVMPLLDHLTNRIGPRLTSSDNLTDACEWARDTFKSFGIDNAHLEEWGTFPVGFNRGPWWGRMTKPDSMELVCKTDAWTAGTRMPSRGPLLRAPKDAAGLAAMQGKLAHVWLLDPPHALVHDLAAAMESEGGFGFVFGARGDLLETSGIPTRDMQHLPVLPMIELRHDGYVAVTSDLDAGKEVEVEFDIRNHFRQGPIPLYDVIADIPGTEHPDEFVVVSGHLDSWDGATGATDNGTGAATTLEAARILRAIGAQPKRTIRFMLWTGEEQGLLGSEAWVKKHKDEMAKYSACLVHDGGTNYVSGIAGMKEMHSQLETVFAPVMDMDPSMPFKIRDIPAFHPIGSDHESFTAVGVPGFFWDQAGRAHYMHTHHTQYDTYDAAIPEYQMHSAVVIATGALGLADLPTLLTRENMQVVGWGDMSGGNRRMLGVQLEDDGVTISQVVDGSAAAKAGLVAGDRILKIGDVAVTDGDGLRGAIQKAPVKTKVTAKRGDKDVTVDVTFAK